MSSTPENFVERLIEGDTSGPTLTERIEEVAARLIADLRASNAPADLIADIELHRARTVYLVELLYMEVRDMETAYVCARLDDPMA